MSKKSKVLSKAKEDVAKKLTRLLGRPPEVTKAEGIVEVKVNVPERDRVSVHSLLNETARKRNLTLNSEHKLDGTTVFKLAA